MPLQSRKTAHLAPLPKWSAVLETSLANLGNRAKAPSSRDKLYVTCGRGNSRHFRRVMSVLYLSRLKIPLARVSRSEIHRDGKQRCLHPVVREKITRTTQRITIQQAATGHRVHKEDNAQTTHQQINLYANSEFVENTDERYQTETPEISLQDVVYYGT